MLEFVKIDLDRPIETVTHLMQVYHPNHGQCTVHCVANFPENCSLIRLSDMNTVRNFDGSIFWTLRNVVDECRLLVSHRNYQENDVWEKGDESLITKMSTSGVAFATSLLGGSLCYSDTNFERLAIQLLAGKWERTSFIKKTNVSYIRKE